MSYLCTYSISGGREVYCQHVRQNDCNGNLLPCANPKCHCGSLAPDVCVATFPRLPIRFAEAMAVDPMETAAWRVRYERHWTWHPPMATRELEFGGVEHVKQWFWVEVHNGSFSHG